MNTASSSMLFTSNKHQSSPSSFKMLHALTFIYAYTYICNSETFLMSTISTVNTSMRTHINTCAYTYFYSWLLAEYHYLKFKNFFVPRFKFVSYKWNLFFIISYKHFPFDNSYGSAKCYTETVWRVNQSRNRGRSSHSCG